MNLPYTLDEMKRYHSMCEMVSHDPSLAQYLGPFDESFTDCNPGEDECLDCQTAPENGGMFDCCGILKYIATGQGKIRVFGMPDGSCQLANITDVPHQVDKPDVQIMFLHHQESNLDILFDLQQGQWVIRVSIDPDKEDFFARYRNNKWTFLQ